LHGQEEFGSADTCYQGAEKREALKEVDIDWLIAERPGKVRTLKQHPRLNKVAIQIEYLKASIRSKVEHPFWIIKQKFGFVKARYKGLAKNENQLSILLALANMFESIKCCDIAEGSQKSDNKPENKGGIFQELTILKIIETTNSN
jgi:IS5 family transposase